MPPDERSVVRRDGVGVARGQEDGAEPRGQPRVPPRETGAPRRSSSGPASSSSGRRGGWRSKPPVGVRPHLRSCCPPLLVSTSVGPSSDRPSLGVDARVVARARCGALLLSVRPRRSGAETTRRARVDATRRAACAREARSRPAAPPRSCVTFPRDARASFPPVPSVAPSAAAAATSPAIR